MSLYRQWRTCGNCGHKETREIPALIAAFEERRAWTEPCINCDCHSFSSAGSAMPALNAEVLEEWSHSESLTLLQQDEDLVLADATAFELLTEFVQRRDILNSKRAVLLSALCILIYDNTPDDDAPEAGVDPAIADSATRFLAGNHRLFDEIGDGYIYDYVKADIYPLIGLSPPSAT